MSEWPVLWTNTASSSAAMDATGRRTSTRVFSFFNDTANAEIYTLSLHDALPISVALASDHARVVARAAQRIADQRLEGYPLRSEEHTSELQSLTNLVCRLLL